MRTQDEKLRISIAVMILSILLVIVMLLVQANPVKEKDKTVAAEKAAANTVLPVSPEALFSQAEDYNGSGDYLSALIALAKIDETWPQYQQAAALIKECEEKLLAEVSSPATIEEYMECERKVNEYLEVRNSTAFLDRKQQLVRDRDAFIAAAPVIEKARTAFESGEYGTSLEMLERALEGNPDNRFINETLEEYRGAFIGEVVQQIEGEVQSENYREALQIAEEALAVYDCEELRSAREQVLKAMDPLYDVYSDMRDTLSEWYGYWTEDSEETDLPFGFIW